MYKLIFVLFATSILFSCKQRKSDKLVTIQDTLKLLLPKADSVSSKTDTHYYWEAVPDDNSNKLVMKRTQPINTDSLNPANIISRINSKYEHIKLQLVKISGDTIFVKIGQSNFLTQQMGSTGADMYLTEATYNLTELNNVGYVSFDFKEGDHAAPGIYSRSDFVNIKFSSH